MPATKRPPKPKDPKPVEPPAEAPAPVSVPDPGDPPPYAVKFDGASSTVEWVNPTPTSGYTIGASTTVTHKLGPWWPVEFARHGAPMPVCARCKQPFVDGDALGYFAGFPIDNTERGGQINGDPYRSLVALAHEGCVGE